MHHSYTQQRMTTTISSGQIEAYSPSSILETEVQICSKVLQYLATGNTPSTISPINPLNFTDEEREYIDTSQSQHILDLTKATAILLDSTSPGPDPLALEALQWTYGMGGGGGMGDWNGCHYLPGSMGQTIRILQDQVALSITKPEMWNSTSSPFLENESWWLDQYREVEYGEGYERSATRFCTVGSYPIHILPYNEEGIMANPPLAGVCLPSSCTARSLIKIFYDDASFSETVLKMASQNVVAASSSSSSSSSSDGVYLPPAASRRYRYMSSLVQSFAAGRMFGSGITCEGESGLAALDENFKSQGYYCTITLIWILLAFVVLGTYVARFKNDKGSSSKYLEGEDLTKAVGINGLSNHLSECKDYGSIDEACSEKQLQLDNSDDDNNHIGIDHHTQSKTNGAYTSVPTHQYDQFYQNHKTIKSNHDTNACLKHFNNLTQNIKIFLAYFDAYESYQEIFSTSRTSSSSQSHGKTLQNTIKSDEILYKNGNYQILEVHPQQDERISFSSSKCLNGLRSLSMIWIILGHTIVLQSSIGYQNPAAFLPPTGMMNSYLGMFLLSSRYAVDTFFFLSGFLLMSGMLSRLDISLSSNNTTHDETTDLTSMTMMEKRKQKDWKIILHDWKIIDLNHVVLGQYAHRLTNKERNSRTMSKTSETKFGNIKWFFLLVLHRMLRILPTYAFVLLLWWKVAVFMGEGPFWPRWATLVAQCDTTAWSNLLFVNNLIPSQCMYHTWYLGVDFQLCTFLTPIFLSLYLRKGCRSITIFLELVYIAGIIVLSVLFSYKYGWSSNAFDGAKTVAFDKGFYINPIFRSTPYIIGFITAQIWHEKSRAYPNFGLTRWASKCLSVLSLFLLTLVTFYGVDGNDRRPCTLWESPDTAICGSGWGATRLAIYNSLTRPIWGWGLSLLCLLSFNGQLNILGLSHILNWSGWDPISKLSFVMYLLHPLIINLWVLNRDSKFTFSLIDFLYSFIGILGMTLLTGVCIVIAVESPMRRMAKDFENIFVRKRKS